MFTLLMASALDTFLRNENLYLCNELLKLCNGLVEICPDTDWSSN